MAVEESVAGMLTVVEGLSPADSGRLIGYDGLDVPWVKVSRDEFGGDCRR